MSFIEGINRGQIALLPPRISALASVVRPAPRLDDRDISRATCYACIKRMSGGGRFLTRGLRAVKAEAALPILAFNVLHAVNAFGHRKMIGAA
jgi:hypothetical protein